jgi:RNA polymerase sigma-70 factor (ECF subfamily)
MYTQTEAELIKAAQKGKLPAFNQLVLQYQGLAYNVAYRVVGDEDMAADATQDSFIKAYKAISQFRGGSFKAWLLRIVTNSCYDLMRQRQRRPSEPLDDLLEDPDHSSLMTDESESPEDHVLRGELSSAIQSCIGMLPDDQRATLVLSDIQGMNYQEVAEVTGVSVGTVKSRLSRARAKLRDILQENKELLPQQYRLKGEKAF